MKESDKTQKAADLAALHKLLSEIKSTRAGDLPNPNDLSDAQALASKYPDDPTFKAILAAIVEAIKMVEKIAEEKRQADEMALAAALKAFEEKAAKDPIGAARDYFNSAEQHQVTQALNNILENKPISEKEHVALIKSNNSPENIAKETILSEHLGTKKEELEQQYRESHDLAEKMRIARELKESKEHLAEIGKREIHRQVVARHEEIYKQEHQVHEVTTEELVKVKGHEIANEFKEVVHEVEQKIVDGLSAIGTLVAKECEAIKEFVEHKDVRDLQAVVEEVKQENGEKAAEKMAIAEITKTADDKVVEKVVTEEKTDINKKDDLGSLKKKKRSVATDKQAHQYATNTITPPNTTPQNHSGITKAPEGRSQD